MDHLSEDRATGRQARPCRKILLASDIYGLTGAFLRLAQEIGEDVVFVSAHADPGRTFESEGEAYARFMETGGVDAYARRVLAVLDSDPAISCLAGFSAGASAAWIACADQRAARLSGAALFYGSRIREHSGLVPLCPVRLVFAEREASFDPASLVRTLADRGLDAHLVRGAAHGFMNELSANYSPALRTRFVSEMRVLFHPEK